MGSFADYQGNNNIPEEKRFLFASQMCRILSLGGMMRTGEVKMFGHTITLLRPIPQITEGKFNFFYNYFEDRPWESAGFNATDCDLWSGKIGDHEFSDVMAAAYMLYEVYNPDYGFAKKDRDFVEAANTIGWLNQILGTHYTLGKRANLWDCIEANADPDYSSNVDWPILKDLVPYDWREAAGGTDLADLLYVVEGTGHLWTQNIKVGSYPSDILKCRQALKKHFADEAKCNIFSEKNEEVGENENAETDAALHQLWDLLKKDYNERSQIQNDTLKPIAELTLTMRARVFVYLTAELKELNFWGIWDTLSKEVYRDERQKEYASANIIEQRKKKWRESVEPIRTSDYLRQDGYFTFYDTPDELKGKPNYYLSDADRLYWWDGTDEVLLTEETDKWLKDLALQHKKLMEKIVIPTESITALQDFLELLDEIDTYYWRILPFESMFYDFVGHISQKEYVAAIELIRAVSDDEQNRKSGAIIIKRKNMESESKNVIENEGRIQIKRLFSIMANKQLRKIYFDF